VDLENGWMDVTTLTQRGLYYGDAMGKAMHLPTPLADGSNMICMFIN